MAAAPPSVRSIMPFGTQESQSATHHVKIGCTMACSAGSVRGPSSCKSSDKDLSADDLWKLARTIRLIDNNCALQTPVTPHP